MVELDPEIKEFLEAGVKLILRHPRKYLQEFTKFLLHFKVRPEIENILAFIAGDMYGTADTLYMRKYGRPMLDEEKVQLLNFIANELRKVRQTFSK